MNFKLALAAAAVVGLAGTAQAADLAKKAPAAADYVKVCDAYGAGFFYIPGSDTCLKIGGYVRAELRTGDHDGVLGAPGMGLGWDRGENTLNTRARFHLSFDARTNTEMGLLRSYIELRVTNDSLGNGANPVDMRAAFIQFAGLTAGRAISNFDFVQGNYNFGNIVFDNAYSVVNQFAYTFAFGNGITATIAAEDHTTTDGQIPGILRPTNNVKMPDMIGNVAIAQAWGRAQLSVALHQVNLYAPPLFDQTAMGWAVGGGVEVNLPMLGAGDRAFFQAQYAKGAPRYALFQDAFAVPLEAVVLLPNDLKLSTAWSLTGGLKHNFSKTIEANLAANYSSYADALVTNDYKAYQLAADLRWKPAAGFYVGPGIEYRHIDFRGPGGTGSQWMGTLRLHRDF